MVQFNKGYKRGERIYYNNGGSSAGLPIKESKCWKKTRDDKNLDIYVWHNKKKDRIVSVEKEYSPTDLKFVILSGKNNDYIDFAKYKKTKKEALNFAKKYMGSSC